MDASFGQIFAQYSFSRPLRCAVNPPHQRRCIFDDVKGLGVEVRRLFPFHKRSVKSGDVTVILHELVQSTY